MDKIERLKIFCWVAEKHSFAQVAKQLGLPRSNVTYAIQALEKEYEVLLFYRTTRQVSLTHEGQLFYDETKQLLTHLKELNHFKHNLRHQTGSISIGLPLRMATQVLLPHVSEYHQRCPQIKVLVNSHDGFSNLLEQQLDCVVRLGNSNVDYLINKPIGEVALQTLATPSYIAACGGVLDLAALGNHHAVAYHIGKSHNDSGNLAFANGHCKLPYRVWVQDTESYLAAGLAGLGIIQIPAFDALPYTQSGQLQALQHPWEALHLPLQLLLSDRKYRPHYLQEFVSWLSDLLQQHCSIATV